MPVAAPCIENAVDSSLTPQAASSWVPKRTLAPLSQFGGSATASQTDAALLRRLPRRGR